MSNPIDAARDDDFTKIVYRQLMADDWDKFKARSNIASTGGGARDLRFRKAAADELSKMFPGQTLVNRRQSRGGARQPTSIPSGRLYWEDPKTGITASGEILFEAPTPSRQGEMRIATVHRYPFFNGLSQPSAAEGAAFLLFAAKRNGEIWAYMTTETGLADPNWHPAIRPHILACMAATRRGSAVAGFIDLENAANSRCNADD